MLSYRHAFHAGNFADVLKHLVLVRLLDYLAAKDAPFLFVDTHAGAGRYDLTGAPARKNREFAGGIARLWDRADLPEPLDRYRSLVREHNGSGPLARYPGSPWLAARLLRPNDRLVAFELHPSEVDPLADLAKGDRRLRVLREDGFTGLIGLLPPRERRGLVLIDPSYEVKEDYRHVVESLREAYRRFATGVYAIWYPVVERRRIDAMQRGILAAGILRVHQLELGVGAGRMSECGMLIVNPPWTLVPEMETCLPWLAEVLGDGRGRWQSRVLAGEHPGR
jgi:23S rRNA (adenine2030-N6)-methyltransferase